MNPSRPRAYSRIAGGLIAVVVAVVLARAPYDEQYVFERAAASAVAAAAAKVVERGASAPFEVAAEGMPLPAARKAFEDAEVELESAGNPLAVTATRQGSHAEVTLRAGGVEVTERARLVAWTSALPPLIAIALALITGRLFLSLGAAILFGSALHVGALRAAPYMVQRHLWENVALDSFKLWILGFTVVLIGMMAVCTAAGGTHGVVAMLSRWVRGPRSAQGITAAMGCVIFFDDYANSVVVGATMRPVTDRFRISREKLAYLVDATAAPIAGLALVSTWIGYEVGLLEVVSKDLGLDATGFSLFMSALPYRFYCLFALALVFLVALTGRDFGAMLTAERRARTTGKLLRDGAVPLVREGFTSVEPKAGVLPRARNALVPIAVVILGAIAGLVWDGGGFAVLAERPLAFLQLGFWRDAFGASDDNVKVLGWVAIAGAAVAIAMAVGQRLLSAGEALSAFWTGAKSMWVAIVTLILAWALAAVATDLGTATYLVALLKDVLPAELVPIAIFLAAAAVAFATGTSWGTMSILIPTAVPLAYGIGGLPLAVIAMGAVLDGAIFGDHCSPISDTTVLSSLATSSDHIDHVRTQLPYAFLGMSVAILIGYLPATLGAAPWMCWPGGVAALALFVRFAGRRTDGVVEPAAATVEADART